MANFENFAILQRALQDEYLRALRADCLRPEQMTDPALDAWQEIVLEGTAEDMIDHYSNFAGKNPLHPLKVQAL